MPVDGEISSFCARVVVAQRYVNREAHPIEAVYVFPLDEGAGVCGFEAIVDGTLVVGEVKEREDAFRSRRPAADGQVRLSAEGHRRRLGRGRATMTLSSVRSSRSNRLSWSRHGLEGE